MSLDLPPLLARWRPAALALAVALATLTPATAHAAPLRQFVADCPGDHRLMEDPIVFPGKPGASHSHDFYGNRSTDAFSNLQSLLHAGTTCRPRYDLSGYWVPTLSVGGHIVRSDSALFEFQRPAPGPLRRYPLGLKMLAGDASAPADDPTRVALWSCAGAPRVPAQREFPLCPAGSELQLYLRFPECWDGISLDSPNHRTHVAYRVGGRCPADHPVAFPRLVYRLRYPTRGGATARLASGVGHTLHGDFFNAWHPAALQYRIDRCLNAGLRCPVGL